MGIHLWDNYFKRTTKENEIHTILKENVLFQDLNSRQLKFVANIVHLRNYRQNETVFGRNEVGVGMYIIVKGAIDITVEENQGEAASSQKQVVITKLGQGDFFGELSLVEEGGRRSATATAMDETTLIGFFKPDLLEILERNPSAGVKITLRLAEVLGRRLRETNNRVSMLEDQLKQPRSLGES
ncbi:MAG: cyclic nucleotide-binding domain-containing protein [Desulfobacterales bacterium]|jgi:CRP-like cAMP-binding protein